ncbi:interleukin-7 receptor subunit alpha [Paralichthys olivaceus]|uniref:interleukin-7 receptor subunit alpha n=1 Tax=Paralichthys olivaceus TaxID=8255 RepID=UPI0037514EFF
MESVWTIFLLLMVGVQAQSGDTDTEAESRISCSSHITTEGNSLTCELLPGHHDDDDDEDEDEDEEEGDSIKSMTLCSPDWSNSQRSDKCVNSSGNTLSFTMVPVVNFTLTVHLKRRGAIKTIVDLKKIVKPRRPEVWNVTLNQELNQAVVYIQSPYHSDYLSGNQMFQLQIWTTRLELTRNISSEGGMKIDMEHLRKNTEYHVIVRAIPVKLLKGSWSEWSDKFSFCTPAGQEAVDSWEMYKLMLCLILLVVVIVPVVFLWKNKIFTYMWPSIPHPKDTLVHIGKPNKGLLLNFYPEVFSALRVSSMTQGCDKPEPSFSPADGALNQPSSTQSSDCRSTTSISTEELELSALLSGSSSAADASLHSASPSPVQDVLLEGGAELCSTRTESEAPGQQEEAYVTMSSFYRVK